jgi:hypothetical protein
MFKGSGTIEQGEKANCLVRSCCVLALALYPCSSLLSLFDQVNVIVQGYSEAIV